MATEKTRDWGHSQQNYALQHVRGDYLIYQDDDDCFLPRALTEAVKLIEGLDPPRPVIGRVKTPNLGILWQRPIASEAVLDGHCLLVPNDKAKLGHFTDSYSGDQAYIHHSLKSYQEWAWADRIWTLTRPHWKLWPMLALEGNNSWGCDLHRDEDGAPGERIANVLLEPDDEKDLFYATIEAEVDNITIGEYMEIAEFLVYAGQSKDIWIKTKPSEGALALALRQTNFKEHSRTATYVEYTHDWPPDFWGPVAPFNETFDPKSGSRNLDWRDDVWGRGRRV